MIILKPIQIGVKIMMLYTFQKAFSQASISQGYFPKVATSQMCNFPSGNFPSF